ncbi:MAG TPA: HAMP domain-containing sensor histidine kinase [Anaerolineales bacterium]|nr:HAMP domain-containing sensor histidine kinase [Anaerolineales bacterium]
MLLRSLRNRLILSHILPALLIIPVMGAAMVYVLETRLLLPIVYGNLAKEAKLMAEITRDRPIFWQNTEAAQALADSVNPYLNGRISLITVDGHLLASSDQADGGLINQLVELPDLTNVQQGEAVALQNGPLAEVITPVYDLNGRRIGIIRMTSQVGTVASEIYQLRYLLGFVLLLAVLAGVGLGSYLAFSINRPIQGVTRSIQALAQGDWQAHVEEQGPEETRLLAKAVNTLVDRLHSLEKARGQLLANLVHELGRPLGAIRSAIQALLHGADKDAQLSHDLLTGMDEETIRLRYLLDDLARLHDQVLGKLELNRSPVQPGDWLISTLAPWEAAARQKGLAWTAERSPNLPVVVMDSDRMAQALGNILSNAIKFTPAGGKVSITVKFEAGRLSVQVTDTGPGIPAGESGKIFQPFYRGSQGRRIVEGMGLGLSIARDIVTAHGGEIRVDSAPGTGSRFTLEIPVEVQQEA